jgi:uncharacterized membrane protein YciS (DUF1049 family)
MAVVVCPLCHVKINVKDEALGRKAKCPKCENMIVLQAAAGPAPAAPIQARPPAAAAKAKKAAPPPVPEDAFEDLDELEEVTPARRKRGRAVEAEDDEEDFDDEPRRKRRRRRDEDYDDEDDYEDVRPRKRSRGGWTGVRSGLQLAFYAGIAVVATAAVINLVSIFGPAAAVAAAPRVVVKQGNRFVVNQANAANVAMGARIVSLLVIGLSTALLVAIITHFVGQCFCISAPPPKAKTRAQIAVFAIAGALIVGLMAACVLPFLAAGAARDMVQQAQQNPQNQQMIANNLIGNMFGFGYATVLVVLIVLALALTSHICWILFHAAVAESLRDRALQSHCLTFLAVAIITPFLVGGVNRMLISLIATPATFFAMFVIGQILNAAMYLGLGIWYLTINRRVVRLIDTSRG